MDLMLVTRGIGCAGCNVLACAHILHLTSCISHVSMLPPLSRLPPPTPLPCCQQKPEDHPFHYTVAVAVPQSGDTNRVMLVKDGKLEHTPEGATVVAWNHSSSFYLCPAAVAKFKDGLEASVPLRLEVARYAKDPTKVSDPFYEKYHAMLQVDMSCLLEPGATHCSGKFPLTGFSSETMASIVPAPEPLVKKAKAVVDEPLKPGEPSPWQVANSLLQVDIDLRKPVVLPWEPPPKPQLKPSDIIPRRPKMAKKTEPREGTEEFRHEIKGAARQLADEYRSLFGDPGGSLNESMSKAEKLERRKKMAFELNRTGQAFAMKEKMKKLVAKIAKEKFQKTGSMTKEETEDFYNTLYVHLMDEMHAALGDITSPGVAIAKKNIKGKVAADSPRAARMAHSQKLLRLADEYEVKMDFANAAKYHKERVLDASDAQPWFDYAEFAMRVHDTGRAEECLREAIAIDPSHMPSLLAFAALLLSQGEHDKAEVFVQGAVELAPDRVLPWALMGLVYDHMDKEKERNNSYYQAKKLNAEAVEAGASGQPSIYMQLALFLLDIHLSVQAEKAITAEMQVTGRSADAFLCLSRVYSVREDYERAEENLEEALSIDNKDPRAWLLLGHLRYLRKRPADAAAAYETVLQHEARAAAEGATQVATDLALYLRLGDVYMLTEKYELAKDVYLQACKGRPCGSTWLGAGQAYYRLKDYHHAEECLAEANIHDNCNPAVWAYLTLVCLKTGRAAEGSEGEQALKEALKQGLEDGRLLCEIGEEYLNLGHYRYAEGSLRRSLKAMDSAHTRCLLGDALREQNETAAAKEEYRRVLTSWESNDDRLHALRQLHQLCLHLNEKDEAASYLAQIDK
eukprot:jgi/Mesvir1/26285/Mv01648-RA.3